MNHALILVPALRLDLVPALRSAPPAAEGRGDWAKAGARCDPHVDEGLPHDLFNQYPGQTGTLIEANQFLPLPGWLKGEPILTTPKMDPNATAPEKKGF